MHDTGTPQTFAIVTPSYTPDFDRCRLLAKSVRKYANLPYRHHIIIPERDRSLFRPLANDSTDILIAEEILPNNITLRDQVHEVWDIFGKFNCSGWVLQQLVKIIMGKSASEDVVLFADSDTTFIKPFDASLFINDGRVRLFRAADFYNEYFEPWINLAVTCMDLPPYQSGATQTNYISNLVTWIPRNVRSMCDHIEKTTGKPWIEAIASSEQMSEYILYGMYVEHILGDASGHYYGKSHLTHEYWPAENLDDAALNNFLSEIKSENIAMMISAKAGISPQRYESYLDSLS